MKNLSPTWQWRATLDLKAIISHWRIHASQKYSWWCMLLICWLMLGVSLPQNQPMVCDAAVSCRWLGSHHRHTCRKLWRVEGGGADDHDLVKNMRNKLITALITVRYVLLPNLYCNNCLARETDFPWKKIENYFIPSCIFIVLFQLSLDRIQISLA